MAETDSMLSPYRVLDLADETGVMCGKILADLGADVIKIEPPCGDTSRKIGPFYKDDPDPEKSLFWFSYNTNKRGVTLDIETTDGQEIFKKLVKKADIVVETFPPGYLKKFGLSYKDLEKINPKLILVSITPFGQAGPWKKYKAPELVAWALGGTMYTWGDADRPPTHISHHSQAHYHTGAIAAFGALSAVFFREATGVGQQLDVSIQEAAARTASPGGVTSSWDLQKKNRQRGGAMQDNPNLKVRQVLPCKDGYVNWRWTTGPNAKRFQQPFIVLLNREGMANDFINSVNFDTLDFTKATQDVVDKLEEVAVNFFMKHTKAELYAEALKHNIQLYPVATTKDITENIQLEDRKFWVKVKHPELGTDLSYPGPWIKTSDAPIKITRRAPLMGEHNREIYGGELGISKEELTILKQTKVI